ncbi:PAS domain S-box-containing protein [Trinickia symbiotica]|uniref:histidine kinase n=1 Tax=Trinickia symbiotica TaxID=863227 RepID=A0A2N7WWW6_9BURK|nr:PAS domain-containing protein [Trinickia symbiotica]PMS33877.1 PAS domain S-box protein [Trinickia symbiotica]PPK42472.1 PAS domain S-box-containing protein [Trinickia symbiotica]
MKNELSRTVDALPGLVWTAFPDGRIEFVNRRWCEYTGLSVEQASGEGWQSAFHPEDRPELLEFWRASLASGQPGAVEARMRRFDGTYRWFLCRASPITDNSGTIVKWCGINADIEDHKQAENALRAQQQRFELIVDGLPTRVVLFTPEGDVLHANRYTLDYAGVTLDDLKAWTTNGLTHPDDRELVIARFRASISTGKPYDAESRHRRADGVYRWFRVQGFPLRDDEGRIVLWYFLQTDIEDRKRTEALLAAEKRLLEMVALGQPLFTVLEELCQLLEDVSNGCLCRISFIDGHDTALRHVVSPGLPSSYRRSVGDSSDSPESYPCTMAASLKTLVVVPDVASDLRWAPMWRQRMLAHGLRSCWATPILSRANEVLGTFTIFQSEPGDPSAFQYDLIGQFGRIAGIAIERARSTDARKRAGEQLRKSAALMAKVERLSSSGSFCWRPTTGSIISSDEFYRIFEINAGVPITMDMILARIHPADLHLVREMIEQAKDGKDVELDHRLLLPDGSVKYMHVQAHATHDAQGSLEYIGAVQDMTERRQSEEALLALRAELAHLSRVNSLGALTASIAHEINQPLAGVMTNASTGMRMLSAEPPNIEGALGTVRRTIRDGQRASEVITRLRALFKKEVVITDAIDLRVAACEVIELLRCEIHRKRIFLRLEAASDLPPVTGDRVQLQQVVLNLLLNAIESMEGVEDRPRQILLKIDRGDGDHLRLAVTDTGVGFDPERAGKLFNAFYTTKRDGMGVGLSVCRRIIESHGGLLWANANDNFGATFSFSIPYRGQGMPIATPSGTARQPARANAASAMRTP